jgi:hypothetical protein
LTWPEVERLALRGLGVSPELSPEEINAKNARGTKNAKKRTHSVSFAVLAFFAIFALNLLP